MSAPLIRLFDQKSPPLSRGKSTAQRSPINGLLVVDQDRRGIEHEAMRWAAQLAGAGGLVLLISVAATGWLLRRHVVDPLVTLSTASRQLSARPQVRVPAGGTDEVGQLARSFNDMADQIEATMRELQDNKAFLQSILDALPEGLRIIGEDHKVLLVNRAYCDQTGLSGGHVGDPCYIAHCQTGPCPPTLFNCPLAQLTRGAEPVRYLHRHRRPDGSEVLAEMVAAAVSVTQNGQSRHVIIETFRDLSKQLRISQEQRLAEIGQLATGVAHEIRNPLASVRLGLQTMLRKIGLGGSAPVELAEYLKLVDGEVEKCIEVTTRLLKLGMPPSERVQLLQLDRIVGEVLSLLAYEAEARGIKLEVTMPEGGLRVLSRDSDLRMLVLNLAQNAFHAMPDGGVLTIGGREDNETVTLEFDDTGVGIDPAILPRIFDPFFSRRADGETGTGLGLTLCKAILTRSRGDLDVQSTPGQGSTFRVTLPVAALGGDV